MLVAALPVINALWKEYPVSATQKTKPEISDEAREQARRAVQASMDIRQ